MGDANYKRLHTELGLCLECSRPSLVGVKYCGIHLYRERERRRGCGSNYKERKKITSRLRYLRYKEEGRCACCGIKLVEGEGVRCMNCNIKSHGGVI